MVEADSQLKPLPASILMDAISFVQWWDAKIGVEELSFLWYLQLFELTDIRKIINLEEL